MSYLWIYTGLDKVHTEMFGMEEHDYPSQSPEVQTPSSIFGINCSTDHEPALIAENQRPTSLHLWLNGRKSQQPGS